MLEGRRERQKAGGRGRRQEGEAEGRRQKAEGASSDWGSPEIRGYVSCRVGIAPEC